MRDDGVVYICSLENTAEKGDMPKMKLVKLGKFWFQNRIIGFNRFYTAQGVNQRVDKLIRIEHTQIPEIGMYAVLGNGDQFRIDMVAEGQEEFQRTKMIDSKYYRQPVIVGLKYTELTLSKVEDYYDVIAADN